MYAYTCIYIYMYISPRQKSHGSRNSENKIILMSDGSAVKLGNQLVFPNIFQSHVWLFLLQTLEIAGKGKERNGNSILHFSFNKRSRAIFRVPAISVPSGVCASVTGLVLQQLEM